MAKANSPKNTPQGDESGAEFGSAPLTSADLEEGAGVIRRELKTLTGAPGVYRMIDQAGEVLYVGKAKNLKNRVSSYANINQLNARIARMVSRTRSMIFVTTRTEVEALLLEANLIKRFKPPFNILLRDDKSFPYIRIDYGAEWPMLTKYRGAKDEKGVEFFGPFASGAAVNRTVNELQKAFLLRTCSDAVFASRSRPCLLYQIKRCSAPCVGRVSPEGYHRLVREARDFLHGRSQKVNRELSKRMETAAEALEFEAAAVYRDRLAALAQVQARQDVNLTANLDADVFAAWADGGQISVQVFFFRGGQNWGNRAYFPRHDKAETAADVLAPFIAQFYDGKPVPPLVLVSEDFTDRDLLAEALSLKAGRRIEISAPQRGPRRKMVDQALSNARGALERKLAEGASQARLLAALGDLLGMDEPPKRIEIYDNSHIQGTNALGAFVVAGPEGFEKAAYRKFNIKSTELTPGDDFAMMREVLTRRFGRLTREDPDREGKSWPDLILIDGGAGQLRVAVEVLAELGVDGVEVMAIAKGPDRNAGREEFYRPALQPDGPNGTGTGTGTGTGPSRFTLPPGDPVLYFLQRLRDESHRFVIGGHRQRRAQGISRSSLDDLPGVGAKRKRALLNHFGSAKAVAAASIEDLAKAEGISRRMAEAIHAHFNDAG